MATSVEPPTGAPKSTAWGRRCASPGRAASTSRRVMPQRVVRHTGGGSVVVVVVVVAVVVVAGAALGAAAIVVAGGGACSLVPHAARTAGTITASRARGHGFRTALMGRRF